MSTLFTVLHIIVAVLLVVLVLLQEGKDAGMQSLSGSSPDSGSFFSKNSGRTKASMMSKLTAVLAVLFLITTMVLVFLQA